MSQAYRRASAPSFGFDRSGIPVAEAITAMARRLWPSKTARNLSSRAGVTHRAAEAWLCGQTGMSADALTELLRSDVGLEVLEAIMGPAKPSWWPVARNTIRLQQLAAQAETNWREIEAMRARLAGKGTD